MHGIRYERARGGCWLGRKQILNATIKKRLLAFVFADKGRAGQFPKSPRYHRGSGRKTRVGEKVGAMLRSMALSLRSGRSAWHVVCRSVCVLSWMSQVAPVAGSRGSRIPHGPPYPIIVRNNHTIVTVLLYVQKFFCPRPEVCYRPRNDLGLRSRCGLTATTHKAAAAHTTHIINHLFHSIPYMVGRGAM